MFFCPNSAECHLVPDIIAGLKSCQTPSSRPLKLLPYLIGLVSFQRNQLSARSGNGFSSLRAHFCHFEAGLFLATAAGIGVVGGVPAFGALAGISISFNKEGQLLDTRKSYHCHGVALVESQIM
jgi:hypothetical protein